MTDDRLAILEKWIENNKSIAISVQHLENLNENHTSYEHITNMLKKSMKECSDECAILEAHNPWLVQIIQIIDQA